MLIYDTGFGFLQISRAAAPRVLMMLDATAVATMAAYSRARAASFRGRRRLEAGALLVRAIPGMVIMVPLLAIASDCGDHDNHVAPIPMHAASSTPFAALPMMSFVQQRWPLSGPSAGAPKG